MIELSKKNRIKLLRYSCVSHCVEEFIDRYYCKFPTEKNIFKVKEDSGEWLEQQIWKPCDDVTAEEEAEVDYIPITDPVRIAELDMALISTVTEVRNKIHYELLQILPPDHPNVALFFSKT